MIYELLGSDLPITLPSSNWWGWIIKGDRWGKWRITFKTVLDSSRPPHSRIGSITPNSLTRHCWIDCSCSYLPWQSPITNSPSLFTNNSEMTMEDEVVMSPCPNGGMNESYPLTRWAGEEGEPTRTATVDDHGRSMSGLTRPFYSLER